MFDKQKREERKLAKAEKNRQGEYFTVSLGTWFGDFLRAICILFALSQFYTWHIMKAGTESVMHQIYLHQNLATGVVVLILTGIWAELAKRR